MILMRYVAVVLMMLAGGAQAAGYPAPVEGDYVAKGFRFHSGEVMDVSLHYTTVGAPTGMPVLILHGTAGSGTGMLTPAFAGALFGPGQALDASRYFIILPDALGTGKSTRPSSGLRGGFPHYNYDDMVAAQYRLVTEGLGLTHLRAIIGNSMGGMQTWVWGVTHPGFADALVPMASQPTEMSARNWMMRRMIIDAVRRDPDYKAGFYTEQPKAVAVANVFFGIATSGGSIAYQVQAPTRALADRMVDERLAAPFTMDANDFLYQWDSSRDYNPAPGLEKITAAVLAINSADDERNPPETGTLTNAMKRVRNGRMLLIPASAETRGHGTTGIAAFWAADFADWIKSVPVGK